MQVSETMIMNSYFLGPAGMNLNLENGVRGNEGTNSYSTSQ
jgi:hypothetical protein